MTALLGSALALLGLTFGQTPALAAAAIVDDARGDMVEVVEAPPKEAQRPEPPSLTSRGRRSDTRIAWSSSAPRFVQLARTGRRLTLWVNLRTDSGRYFTVGVQADRTDWTGQTTFLTRRGDECEHVRNSWHYSLLDNGLGEDMDDRSWTQPLRRR